MGLAIVGAACAVMTGIAPVIWPNASLLLWEGLFAVSGLVLCFSVAFLFDEHFFRPQWGRTVVGPAILIIVSVFGFIAGLAWSITGKVPMLETDADKTVSKDQENVPQIFVECHFGTMPKTIPTEGRIYVLTAMDLPIERGGGGIGEFFGPPGTEWSWPTPSGSPFVPAYRCQLTNYANAPLFNVTLELTLIFAEAIRDKNSARSGKIVLERPWIVEIPKLDVGPSNPFSFYIYNQTSDFLQFNFPDHGTARMLMGEKQIKIALMKNIMMAHLLLSPPLADEPKSDQPPSDK